MFKNTRKKLNFKSNSVTFKNCDLESSKHVDFQTLDNAWVVVEDVKRQIDVADSILQRSAKKKNKPGRREGDFVPISTAPNDTFGTAQSRRRMAQLVINEPGVSSLVATPKQTENGPYFATPNTAASPAIAQWVTVEPASRKSVHIMSKRETKKLEPSKSSAITHFICKPNNVHNSAHESNLACWESLQAGSPVVKRHVCALSSNESSSNEKEMNPQCGETLHNYTLPITTTAPSLNMTSTASTTNTTTTKICAVIPPNSVPSYPGFCNVEKLSLAERQPWKYVTAKMKERKIHPPSALESDSHLIQRKQTKSITPRTWREELKLLREENTSKTNNKAGEVSEIEVSGEKLNQLLILPEYVHNIEEPNILLNEASNTPSFPIKENINEGHLSEENGNLFKGSPERKCMPVTTSLCEINILQKYNGLSSELSPTRVSPSTKKAKRKLIQDCNVIPECPKRKHHPENQETIKFIYKQRKKRREQLKEEKEKRARLVENKKKNLESLKEQSLKILKKSQQKQKILKQYQLERQSGEYATNNLETEKVNDQIHLDNESKKQMFDSVENPKHSDSILSDESLSCNVSEQNKYIPNVKKPDIEYNQRLKNLAKIVCNELEIGILDDESKQYEMLKKYEELKLKKPSHSLSRSYSILRNQFEVSDNKQSSRETNSQIKKRNKKSLPSYNSEKENDHLDFKRINCYKWISCINNCDSKISFDDSINKVSDCNIQNIPNGSLSQSHSPPIKLREVKSNLSDSLKKKMLLTDKTIDLLKEEKIYYQQGSLKLDQIGNMSDSFLDVPETAHSSVAYQVEKQLSSANKIQTVLQDHKVHNSVEEPKKIEFFSDPKKIQQLNIPEHEKEMPVYIEKISSNKLQKDWLEPECLKPCPYTIMTAIKNKLAALQNNMKEKSVKELSSNLYHKPEVRHTDSAPENEINNQTINEFTKEQFNKVTTAAEIQNDTYASSIESMIATPEIPKLNLPCSPSEHEMPELEIPAIFLTRKRKCQKRLDVESQLSTSSKQMTYIERDINTKYTSAEISNRVKSVSCSKKKSALDSVQVGENIHECGSHVSDTSTFLNNLKESVASMNTNLSDHLKTLSTNITERDETHRSSGENSKLPKYSYSENSSVLYNESEEIGEENSNVLHPTALHLQLQAGLNLLDSLDESRLRLAYIEGLHALNTAQQRTKKIALAFETQKVQHGNTIFSMEIKNENEKRKMAENFDKEREEYERLLEKIETTFENPNLADKSLPQRTSPTKSSTEEIPSLNISQVSSFSNYVTENIERNTTVGSISKVSLPVSLENNIHNEEQSATDTVNLSKSEIYTRLLPYDEHILTNGSSIMYEKLIEDEDIRVQEHLSLLDSQEKDLLKFVTSRLKYLEDEKRMLLECGNKDALPSIKKRQRNLILRLHKDRDEIQKLKTAYKTTLEARKTLLLKHQSIVNAYESTENPSCNVKKKLRLIGDKNNQNVKTQSPTKIRQTKYEVPGSSNSSSIKTEISKSSHITSGSNSGKLESVNKLSDHSKRSGQTSAHTSIGKMSVPQEINLTHGCSKKEAAAQTSSPENRKILPSKWSLSDGEGWNHYELLMWEKRLQEENQRLKQPKASTQDRSTSPVLLERINVKDVESADITTDLSQRRSDNSSVPEDLLAVSSRHSNSSVKTSHLVEEQYATESLESPQSSEGVKNMSTTQSITEIKDDCSPRNNSNIISLYSSPNITLPKRFNDLKLKMNLSPVYQGQQKRRYSSGSDESIIYSQTETPSEQSDLEGRISALKEQLRKRKMEAEKLRREQRRAHREMLKAKEQSLVNQIQALDSYIEKVKESLEQGLDSQLSSIVKPKIKQPRVAEKNSNKTNNKEKLIESNNDLSITSYDNNLSASHITLSVEEKLSIADTSEDTIVTATRESAPESDSISSEIKSNTICEEVPGSFSNSFTCQDSSLKEENIEKHSEKTQSSLIKTTDEEMFHEKPCTLEFGVFQSNGKDTPKLDTSPEMSTCSQESEIMEDITVDERSESSKQVSQVKTNIPKLDVDFSELLPCERVEFTNDVNFMKSDSTEINEDVNEIIDEVDGRTPSSSETITFDGKDEIMEESKSEIIKVFLNDKVDEISDCNISGIDVDVKESNILSETFVIDYEKNDLATNDYSDSGEKKDKATDILDYITNSIFEQLLKENLCCNNKDEESGFKTLYKKNEADSGIVKRLENKKTNEQTLLESKVEIENGEMIGKSLDSENVSKTVDQHLHSNNKENTCNYEIITSTILNRFLDDATDNFFKIYNNKKEMSKYNIENLPNNKVQISEYICANDGHVNNSEEEFSDEHRNLQESFVDKINVTQRVHEIMAEALHSAVNSETSMPQDFMVTAYDISPTEDGSATGSPSMVPKENEENHCLQKVELSASGGPALEGADNEGFAQDWFDEDFGLSSTRREAEELRLQQLQIEQEIQQLQQQAFLYVREIPNKPPPPYTPRGQTVSGVESSGVPTSRTEVCELASKATELVLSAVAAGADPTTLAPPAEFCTGGTVSQVFCRFLFELSCRLVAEACGDNKVSGKPWEWPDVSRRNPAVRCRSHQTIQEIVNKQIMTLFGLVPRPPIRDCLAARWKRRDHVDEMLMRESQDEEPSWTDYERDEITVKNEMTETILVDLLDETTSVFLNIFLKKSAYEQS